MKSADVLSVNEYLKRVKRLLICPDKTKKQLLSGLRQELLEQCDKDNSHVPVGFASPQETAAELQENVSESEIAMLKKRRKKLFVFTALLAGILFIFMLVYLVILMNDHEVVVTERIHGYVTTTAGEHGGRQTVTDYLISSFGNYQMTAK
ncbi:MAG: hypothetical protein RSD35_06390 [Oscillospiraceae bacterium]